MDLQDDTIFLKNIQPPTCYRNNAEHLQLHIDNGDDSGKLKEFRDIRLSLLLTIFQDQWVWKFSLHDSQNLFEDYTAIILFVVHFLELEEKNSSEEISILANLHIQQG